MRPPKHTALFVCLLTATLSSLAFSILLGSEPALPVPAFLWSPKDLLSQTKNVYKNLEGISHNDIADFILNELLNTNDKPTQFDFSLKSPNAVVLFIADELDAVQVSQVSGAYQLEGCPHETTFLKDSILTSEASVVFPHTFAQRSGTKSPFVDLLSTAKHLNIQTLFHQLSDSSLSQPFIDISTLSSEKPSLIIISLPFSYSLQTDSILKHTSNLFQSFFNDNIVFFFTALKSSQTTTTTTFEHFNQNYQFELLSKKTENFESLEFERFLQVSTTRGETFIRMDPQLITGLLSFLLFFGVISIFLCCIDCVQAPKKFPNKIPSRGKEFN